MKIAIIGSGISGLASAYFLNQKHDITLFEKNDYLGGHSNTAVINYLGKEIAVDTGFIVLNHRTYPNLKAFFELLDVKTDKSDMSFGIKDLDGGLEYAGTNLFGLFAQKRNLLNIKYWGMLKDIVKFNKSAISLIEKSGVEANTTLEQFVNNLKLGEYFQKYYLFPMAAAIWSCPMEIMRDYPAKTFLQFFYNHGLLTVLNQPQWHTVSGGSKEYVKKMSTSFTDRVKLNCGVKSVKQDGKKIELIDEDNKKHQFDKVIFACHSDQALKIISDKTPEEKEVLENIRYSKNKAVLHKNAAQMPKRKSAWASWIYLFKTKEKQVSLSYWMNNLQNIDHKYPLFVTLNPCEKIPKEDIFGIYDYEHPIFDLNAIKAQGNLKKIQGKRGIYFCGAWVKYGFHEDGLKSAIDVLREFNIAVPWK